MHKPFLGTKDPKTVPLMFAIRKRNVDGRGVGEIRRRGTPRNIQAADNGPKSLV